MNRYSLMMRTVGSWPVPARSSFCLSIAAGVRHNNNKTQPVVHQTFTCCSSKMTCGWIAPSCSSSASRSTLEKPHVNNVFHHCFVYLFLFIILQNKHTNRLVTGAIAVYVFLLRRPILCAEFSVYNCWSGMKIQ